MSEQVDKNNLINHDTYDELYSLMEYGRVPTKLELDRFIRSHGYILLPKEFKVLEDEEIDELTNENATVRESIQHTAQQQLDSIKRQLGIGV